jgi:hypothetical protein
MTIVATILVILHFIGLALLLGGFLVQLSCAKPAFFVSIQAEGIRGEFDDNCITLLPSEPRVLRFVPKEPVTLAAFQSALHMECLNALHR